VTTPDPRVLDALISWRDGIRTPGRDRDAVLPTDADLVAVAAVQPPNRAAFAALSLERPSAVAEFGAGLLMAAREGYRAVAAGDAVPLLPPQFVPLLPSMVAKPSPSPSALFPPPALDVAASVVEGPQSRRRSKTGAAGQQPAPFPDAPTTPAPPLAGTPAPAAPAPPAPTAPLGAVAPEPFVAYDVTRTASAAVPRAQLVSRPQGGLTIEWAPPASAAAVRLYRVIASDQWPPLSPDTGTRVATTTDVSVVDARPFTGPVRHVQVWMNSGADEASARQAQAVMVAEASAVAPPTNFQLEDYQGTVVGHWQVARGVHRVEVQRVPRAARGSAGYLPQYSIGTEDDALDGMQDTGCGQGEEYEYRLFAVVVDNGADLISDPVTATVTVGGTLGRIGAVRAKTRVDRGRTLVDLEWDQAKAGEVQVYCTAKPPVAGADDGVIAISGLVQTGLQPELAIPIKPKWVDGKGQLSGIPWPDEMTQVFFTAVSIGATGARVGGTAGLTRTGEVKDPILRQRVQWQHLTFSWPKGANRVWVYRTPVGVPLPEPLGTALVTIDADKYKEHGGLRLKGVLDPQGCDVHLVPVTDDDGEAVVGGASTVTYPGLFCVQYRLRAPEPGRLGVFGKVRGGPGPTMRTVEVRGDRPVPPDGLMLTWHLVAQRSRLPLSPGDGKALAMPQRTPAPGQNGPTGGWTAVTEVDLGVLPTGSYVRLFAVPDPGVTVEVALLDPSVKELQT
jgi:hypothetical protein